MSDLTTLLRRSYLDLLKQSLTDSIHQRTYSAIPQTDGHVEIVEVDNAAKLHRSDGRDWPAFGETMVGIKRLDNLESLIEIIAHENIPGDLIETGVWRGGASIFMKGVLRALGIKQRLLWVADSFQGLPPPNSALYPQDKDEFLHTISFLASSEDEVRSSFERYGLLDDDVRFLRGWFSETLPTLKDQQWSLIRLDGDLYESTMVGLECLYPNLSRGGFCVIDDYGCLPCCQKAVDDFRAHYRVDEPMVEIDWTGRFWRKS